MGIPIRWRDLEYKKYKSSVHSLFDLGRHLVSAERYWNLNLELAYASKHNFTLEKCNAGEPIGVAITLSQDPQTDGIA